MFNSGNSTPFTMPVIPAGYSGGNGGGNGMNGWGADWIWIILVFALIWGNGWGNNGNNGGGSNGSGGVMDAYVLNSDFATLQRQLDSGFANTTAGITQVNNGLCNGFYQQAQLVNGVQMQIANEARGTDNTICNLGNSMMQGFNTANVTALQGQNALATQISDCCCKTQSGMKDIQYQNAQDSCAIQNTIQNTTRDIIDNQNANSRQILDFLVNDKISTLQSENQSLKLAASQAAQNNYLISQLNPTPVPAYPAASPCGLGNWSPQILSNGYGNNCGCGCA